MTETRILVVDDNEMNRDMLSRRLEKQGHTVDIAVDGREALEKMRAVAYDLVLLDIMMPEMDGYEVLETIKADPALQHVPVVMISAVGEIESVVKCLELGAEDYLPKPFNPVILRARVDASLEKKRLRDRERLYAESLKREMLLGRKIQQDFLPESIPSVDGWEIAVQFTPAMEVAGDFYDLFMLGPDSLAVVIADVCGKGVGAALYMALFRSLLRATASQQEGQPVASIIESTMKTTNDYIAKTHGEANMFATIVFAVIDVRTGDVAYANAGHDAPMIAGAGTIRERWMPTSPAVGLMAGMDFKPERTSIAAGETLLFCTDGVVEARGESGLFGEERLQTLVAAHEGTPETLLADIGVAVHAHTAAFEPSDDITLVALRRK
jgi:serine phosphatase RsbU (regulator of sigma subunit)